MADFDQFSKTYRDVLDQSVAISGEASEYFVDYKARYMAAMAFSWGIKKILDFGCGVGSLSVALKKYLPNVSMHGYDISSACIERVDSTLAAAGRFTTDLSRLDHDYDAIVVATVLHHIPVVKRKSIIRELANRLSTNGILLVFEHNPVNPITRWVVNHCPFDRDAVLLKPKEVIAHLYSVGLQLVKQDYIVFFPRPFSLCRPIERFLWWCPLGAQYVIIGKKLSKGTISKSANMDSGH